jgi:hypothetical protein
MTTNVFISALVIQVSCCALAKAAGFGLGCVHFLKSGGGLVCTSISARLLSDSGHSGYGRNPTFINPACLNCFTISRAAGGGDSIFLIDISTPTPKSPPKIAEQWLFGTPKVSTNCNAKRAASGSFAGKQTERSTLFRNGVTAVFKADSCESDNLRALGPKLLIVLMPPLWLTVKIEPLSGAFTLPWTVWVIMGVVIDSRGCGEGKSSEVSTMGVCVLVVDSPERGAASLQVRKTNHPSITTKVKPDIIRMHDAHAGAWTPVS